MANPYANKPFLNAQMSVLLNDSFTQDAASFTVTQSGTTLTIAGIVGSPIKLGSYIDIAGLADVAVVTFLTGTGGNGDYKVDLSQTVVAGTAATITGYTVVVQNALQTLFSNPTLSAANYYQVVAPIVEIVNTINTANPSTSVVSGKNGLRTFVAYDDGTPVFDSGKCTIGASATNQITSLVNSANFGNTWTNFKNKIAIMSPAYNSTNTSSVTDGASNTVTLTYGTAGGNGINENHNSRPEFLAALFKDSGNAYAKRFSSSTSNTNYYYALRFGANSEENQGTVRVNVPTVYA